MNFRFGMMLEVATAAGSVLGGLTAQLMAQSHLQQLFGLVTGAVALLTVSRANKRNIIVDPLGRSRRARRPLSRRGDRLRRSCIASSGCRSRSAASFIAGNVSSLLGIGGGVIKVPVLNGWCGMPLRAAAATSAFMIGVTATGGAIIYYVNGQLLPAAAAAAILGVQLGSWSGLQIVAAHADSSR